jgi:hypothetical protein
LRKDPNQNFSNRCGIIDNQYVNFHFQAPCYVRNIQKRSPEALLWEFLLVTTLYRQPELLSIEYFFQKKARKNWQYMVESLHLLSDKQKEV